MKKNNLDLVFIVKNNIIRDMKKEYQVTNYESDLTDKQWEVIK